MSILCEDKAYKKPTQPRPYIYYFFRTVFLYRGPVAGPLYQLYWALVLYKRIYLAAVSQRSRTGALGCTVLVVHKRCLHKLHMLELISLTFSV